MLVTSVILSHKAFAGRSTIFITEVRFLHAYACPLLGRYPQVYFCTYKAASSMLNLVNLLTVKYS